ncbi:ankyrin repeat-containing domain protein [Xylariaceae sp. FL0804]|nr:ankyrin repeat-containing domain protein [Xylariaceae sp. FL0804]
MAHITDLPPELWIMIAEASGEIAREEGAGSYAYGDLARVSRTCRRLAYNVGHLPMSYNIRHAGSSALPWIAKTGNVEAMMKALALGADINMANPALRGVNLATGSSFNTLRRDVDFYYGTPLHYAALHGQDAMVRLLLQNGAKLDVKSKGLCNCRRNCVLYENDDQASITVLHSAAARGRDDLIQRALEHYPRQQLLSSLTQGDTAIHYACQCRNPKRVIQLLVNAGAKIDVEDQLGVTPLFQASLYDNFVMAKELIDLGARKEANSAVEVLADFNLSSHEELELWCPEDFEAIRSERSIFLKALLAKQTEEDPASILLEYGLDPNVRDEFHCTPLTHAVYGYWTDVPETLELPCDKVRKKRLTRDEDIEEPKEGLWPLITSLVRSGATLDAVNVFGHSPLAVAALEAVSRLGQNDKSAYDVLEFLLRDHAPGTLSAEHLNDTLALCSTRTRGKTAVDQLLEKYGARLETRIPALREKLEVAFLANDDDDLARKCVER